MREVPLPRDHEGREISLDTEVLFDANDRKVRVTSYRYRRDVFGHSSVWKVFSPDARGEDGLLPTSGLYLTPHDSWERLFDDLDRCIEVDSLCGYYSPSGDCCDCALLNTDDACGCGPTFKSIKDRILKLRGEQDA